MPAADISGSFAKQSSNVARNPIEQITRSTKGALGIDR